MSTCLNNGIRVIQYISKKKFNEIRPEIVRRQFELDDNLKDSLSSIDQVYGAALQGSRYEVARIGNLLSKFESKIGKRILNKAELKEAVQIMEMQYKMSPKTQLKLSKRQVSYLRRLLLDAYGVLKNVPVIARAQYVITLDLLLEAFVGDTLRNIFDHNIESMKSGKTTLRMKN